MRMISRSAPKAPSTPGWSSTITRSIRTGGPESGMLFPPSSPRDVTYPLLPSEYIKEPAAEFFGVMILIIFGNGVDCQTVLSKNTAVASAPLGVSTIVPYPECDLALTPSSGDGDVIVYNSLIDS